ncbi:DUF3025 domain-containing protein [Ramlibacter sp. GTP1]|uniref:DUF3025 domain-containing protein n=1 Tax=Ramlibacter albus TaxID=2079448 RepID=A0A923MAE5_9BURK|nr:DUF3025 domain-containing protein [Ramlibacter albus]MBC5765467.1 DUF3025 domain-containing protein [Ramlibacter albus]
MTVDWSQPWYAPWRNAGPRIERAASLLDALNAEGAPVDFVPPAELPDGTPYETFIFETGRCPTRDNLHDLFNALVWSKFPHAKRALNRLQASEIERSGIGARRGPVRDAITVFDENGALLAAPQALWDALLARDWRRLFVDLRPLWQQAQLTIFGHALLEKLTTPRKDMTAHVWCAPAPLAFVDEWLAGEISAERLAAKPFTPLPVLGVPGWSEQNANFSFYDDSLVFRPARQNEGHNRGDRRAPRGS